MLSREVAQRFNPHCARLRAGLTEKQEQKPCVDPIGGALASARRARPDDMSVREIVEWSGGTLPVQRREKSGKANESAARHSIPVLNLRGDLVGARVQ